VHPGPLLAPNKKVGSRPLDRATYLEAYQYKFTSPKTQDRLRDANHAAGPPMSGLVWRQPKKKASPGDPERPWESRFS